MRARKSDFLEEIAVSIDYWVDTVAEAMTDLSADLIWVDEQEPYQRLQKVFENSELNNDDLKKVIAECLRGFTVSVLTAIDGGTALAEKGRVYLVDDAGNNLGEGLHDDFVSHLLETGRLRE
ncbi:hypothetical protein [Parazoarcus communis]|uniref:Uncharacterized protein n=1 Tax=Parazoarcus communis SWub3 = DSM 12120 TaxID=1121029 RepID=A0A323UP96_9RHOO|nr:hypothetical protein [Parazoarcus communis]NMG72979.1 hypothetical protein [Parazoarcus communis SWub3 = DSM 12120]PZA14219.1 hypothetical protein DNK49_23075 [Azoarcus communis] [Parazoarcus communis SWub3 = DSM 12120]